MNILVNCFHLPKLSEGAGGAGVFITSTLPKLGENANVRVIVSQRNKEDYSFETTKSICLDTFVSQKLEPWWEWADVYYDPQNGLTPREIPINLPTVCHIYDLQHEVYPHFFSKGIYDARNREYGWAIKRSDAVFTISEWEKKNIKSFIPNSNPIVIYLSSFLYEKIKYESPDLLNKTYQQGDYYMFPAVRWAHKNHFRLIEALAFSNYRRHKEGKAPINIIFTGASHALSNDKTLELIDTLSQAEHFQLPGYVSDEELALLYLKAKGVIFPSLYEGFGIPIIDAMSFKVPVLASREACIPEVAGSNITYFENAFDSFSMSKAIDAFDEEISKGKYDVETPFNDARSYSLNRITNDMLNAFEEVIKNKKAFKVNNLDTRGTESLSLKANKTKDLTVIIDIPSSSGMEQHEIKNSIFNYYNVILLEETSFGNATELKADFDGYKAYYKKDDIESKKIALENLLVSCIDTEYTMLIDFENIDLLYGAKINIAIALLEIDDIIVSAKLSTKTEVNGTAKVERYIPKDLSTLALENFEFMSKSETMIFLPNFIFKTWALRDGGMIGSQKRIGHFIGEQHLIL